MGQPESDQARSNNSSATPVTIDQALESPDRIIDIWIDRINQADDLSDLDDLRVKALGKKGQITSLMQQIGQLPGDQRGSAGQALNKIKDEIASAVEQRKATLDEEALQARLEQETIDITLPARAHQTSGSLHPIQQTIDEVVSIFTGFGFSVADGPDIEDDAHNFTKLNFPPHHPARQMHDTFYVADDAGNKSNYVLRTHTSPVQIRVMEDQAPPIRVIVPGRTFRADYDQTHTPMFHQAEGLVIDKSTHMGDLKGVLMAFCERFFELEDVPLRFRPSYFPFTEPSAEVDIGCKKTSQDLYIGDGDDWLEILGCGMVHPNVIQNVGLDPDVYQGYAFGMGIERMAMLKYGISDLRSFYECDLRWLKHYGFSFANRPNAHVTPSGE
jgi:phenylalanyl-tRNA synthetase alpha chain